MPSEENEHLHDLHAELLQLAADRAAGRETAAPAAALAADDGDDFAVAAFRGELGHYRLLRVLGHGGQGVVYLACDTRLDRQVALKLLSTGGAVAPAARERFRREARAASRLRHPGICTIHEADEVDGQRYLAMEFVDGESLPAWIARRGAASDSDSGARRLRVERAFAIVEQLARAVHAAHEAGVVHRDLKPANVMLRADGSPVVLDFGLARDDSEHGATLTAAGDVLGTPAYLPPERRKTVAPLFVARHELTQGQWQRLSLAKNPSRYSPSAENASKQRWTLRNPVEKVDWHASTELVARYGLRLPDETEWEYAYRAGTTMPWWCGENAADLEGRANVLDERAAGGAVWQGAHVSFDDGHVVHAPVGTYEANAFGLHDMHGNVWEWCSNPNRGGADRSIRGGSYFDGAWFARSAMRTERSPEYAWSRLGIRPVREIRR